MTSTLFDTQTQAFEQPSFLGVDFFCGAGGTTRGMIDAGGYVIGGIDKVATCRETFEKNNRNTALDGAHAHFFHRDIFNKSADYPEGQQLELVGEMRTRINRARAMAPDAPLMFAICAPCQPFTGLSRKALTKAREEGRLRDRNLLLETLKMIDQFTPEIVVSENVAGIQENKFGGVWDIFVQALLDRGYVPGYSIVNTEGFSIAQSRKRSILVAIKRKHLKDQSIDKIPIPAQDPNGQRLTVKDVLKDYPPLQDGEVHPSIPNHRAAKLLDINRKRISHAKPGESNDYLWNIPDGSLALECHKNAMDRTKGKHKTFTDVYTRMHPDKPAPTITTNCNSISNGRYGHYDVTQNRAISLREAAKLQSFEDDYIFYPVNQSGAVARQIGNAVPPKLSKFFSEYALSLMIDRRVEVATDLKQSEAA